MAVVAVFFKLSMAVRDLHNHLVEVKGVPSWASYSLFAGVTLALGCILGFVSIFIISNLTLGWSRQARFFLFSSLFLSLTKCSQPEPRKRLQLQKKKSRRIRMDQPKSVNLRVSSCLIVYFRLLAQALLNELLLPCSAIDFLGITLANAEHGNRFAYGLMLSH
ncbi:unnamed protein product [Strongylus vulgaris]|uniref:Uncharacterized protein n=1 Tax=Strongylus vulgaris TaxID=40348 RepID=A0A3P7KR68_STRVU|nr:unnamed protein product [Strongylus vulgaris]